MFKIPDEFRDIPEALKVREAEARFEAAIEQERATQQSGERVHVIGGQLRQARGCVKTLRVFDSGKQVR